MFEMNVHKKRYSGLTVLEMMIVIAIISILVAVLFPTIYRTREVAKSAVCLGRLKQIGIAFHVYIENEAEGRMPGWTGSFDYFGKLVDLLAPYIGKNSYQTYLQGNLEVFRCPSNRTDIDEASFSESVKWLSMYGNRIDYEYNGYISNEVAKDKIANPSWATVLWDRPLVPPEGGSYVHRNGANFLFYDGHARYVSRSEQLEPHAPDYDATRNYATWGLF